jgi:hypothetical protein
MKLSLIVERAPRHAPPLQVNSLPPDRRHGAEEIGAASTVMSRTSAMQSFG